MSEVLDRREILIESWIEDRIIPVFVVVTGNHVSVLAPQLIRNAWGAEVRRESA